MNKPARNNPATARPYVIGAVCGLSVIYAALYLAVFLSFRWAPLLLFALAPFALTVCGGKNGAASIGIVTIASAILWESRLFAALREGYPGE